jgi:predicted phosphodiesterase
VKHSSDLRSILIVPDTHRPYHDKKGWELLLKVGKTFQPHHLICIGDFADFYSVSAHSKDPLRTSLLHEELENVAQGFDELDALGATEKIFIAGNHEDRLTRYLQDKAPELFPLINIPEVFALRKRGWAYVPYKSDTKIGKLYLTHDVGYSGRNAAFRALDTYQHSNITGHTHRLQYVVEGNAVGEFKLSAQFGWLGDSKKIDYMHRAKVNKDWALGFGFGYLHPKSGIAYLTPVPIIPVKSKYTCVVNGQLFTA